MAERCCNNQAEQFAIAKAIEKMKDLYHLKRNQRSLAIHTDSRITLGAIANPSNHQKLVEQIREEIRGLENDNWIIHFIWVKEHDDNYRNVLADHLAKEAACSSEADIAYIKITKSAVISELKRKGVQVWQREWDASTEGELTKIFFPSVKDRISKRLQMCINLSTIVTGHGKRRSYFHRFKIVDFPTCLCKKSPQTADHLLWECELLRKQGQVLRISIMKFGGNWSITNFDLANKYAKLFHKFLNTKNLNLRKFKT
jgi:ribonuclease HI